MKTRQSAKGAHRRAGLSRRALVVGLLASGAIAAATPYNDFKIGATFLSGNYFPVAHFFCLLLLILLVNPVLGKCCPRKRFKSVELGFIWAMLTVSSAIGSSGLMRYWIPQLPAPAYFATPENGWADELIPAVPKGLLVTAPRAVKGFFEGLRGWETVPWDKWIVPLANWGLFILLLYFSFFCFSVIVRAQWVEHERFTFPLVQLPVEVVQTPGRHGLFAEFFHSKVMWWTVGLLTVYHTLCGLHRFYPMVPEPPGVHIWVHGFRGKLGALINEIGVFLYPMVVGLSYLINNEMLFSLWFLFVVYRFSRMMLFIFGINPAGVAVGYCDSAYSSFSSAGAALMIVIWVVWVGRSHFKRVFGSLRHWQKYGADEGLPYRWAVLGFLLALSGMLAWLVVMKVSFWMAVATLAGMYLSYITLTWLVAQSGVLFLQGPFTGSELLTNALGGKLWDRSSIVVPSLVENIFAVDLRELMLPQLVQAQKLADVLRLNRRHLLGAMALAVLVALLASGYVAIVMPYESGGGTSLFNWWTYVNAPQRPLRYAASELMHPKGLNWLVLLQFAGAPWARGASCGCARVFPGLPCIPPAGWPPAPIPPK